jgi:hypothetical protein
MASKFENAATSTELWKPLQTAAGLQAEGYDAPVVDELRRRLQLQSGAPMADALAAERISVEVFVEAFFASVSPYVAMWGDLLALFERPAAATGTANLQIAYRFDRAGRLDLDFDLEHFRRVAEILEQILTPFDLTAPNVAQLLWGIPNALDRGAWQRPTGVGEIDRFDATCRDPNAPWPASMPPPPQADSERLDLLISEAWTLLGRFLSALRSISSDHSSLMSQRYEDGEKTVAGGVSASTVRLVESDYWLPTTAVALTNASKVPQLQSELTDRLDRALAPLRNSDPTRSEPRRRLREFLQLPIWKHRYELYSNWVCTQIVGALEDQGVRIHADRGEIRFAFSGTHLATFEGFTPRLHLWTELRVPLDDPVGQHRTSAIQPDITLLADPITARRSPLAVECKQYKKASSRNFADAITDYARGHPEARIVLVNYGPASGATVLKLVAPAVVDRAVVIGDLRPGEDEQLSAFRCEVRRAVGIAQAPAAEMVVSAPCQITLRWGATPKDLDLHVNISGPWDEEDHIYYENLGSSDASPFCSLERDVTDGRGAEVVSITRWLPATYDVFVENYSDESPLGRSGARLTIDSGEARLEFRCPKYVTTRHWAVCSIDGATGKVTSFASSTR